MSYGVHLEEGTLRVMGGLPSEALDVLIERLARICLDPYDRMLSMPVSGSQARRRMAELGDDRGFIEFVIDEDSKTVRVASLVWLS